MPLLPTTPFLLLAAFLYVRSSKRCYDWLMRNRLVGDYLHRYHEGRSMRRSHKVLTVSFLWIVLAVSAALAVGAWWVRGVLAGVGIFSVVGRLLFETSLDVGDSRFPSSGAWNPVDDDGIPLANGPYIYVIISDGRIIGQGKMVVQR